MVHIIEQNLVHVAALFTLVCYLFRDQIKLRIFAALGDAILSLYYYFAFTVPLWDAMVWTILNVVINVAMIGLILRDGRIFQMTDSELSLYQDMQGLTPGQFRILLKQGTWHTAEEPMLLTTEGEKPDRLYYVLNGAVTIEKAGRSFPVDSRIFIGELAFLRKKPATATVRVGEGATYISWAADDLDKLFKRNDDMRNAMNAIINRDMAEKVANA
ncbi:MAG: popeye domain-containing protein [Proteobacteria bacterium]|nr:popeye domain-containing protein [Pseudomonadota bacterium]